MKIEMTDGRILVGVFLCTDKDRNIILGSTDEYIKSPNLDSAHPETSKDGRSLGLAMIPGHCIVSICVDADLLANKPCCTESEQQPLLTNRKP